MFPNLIHNWILVFVLGCALLCASCGTSNPTGANKSERAPITLRYSFIQGTQLAPQYAYEKGVFAEYGLNVQLQQINSGSKAMAALIAGEVDIFQGAGTSVIYAAAAGEDVVLIGGLYNTHLYSLMTRPEIAGAADLKGKAVAISQPGSGSDSAMRAALAHFNLRPDKDVALLMIGSQSDRLAAMESGQIAGTLVTETVKAKERGYRELLDLSALKIPFQAGGIAATRRFLQNNRATALNLMRAIAAAIARMKGDREGVLEVMAKYLKLDRQADAALLEEGYLKLVRHNLVDTPYPTIEGIAAEIAALSAENPNVAKLKPEDIVDLSLVRELETTGSQNRSRQHSDTKEIKQDKN